MKIATVIPLKKGTWKENLTYFTAQDVVSGSIVTIPLRNKKILGLVMSVENAATAKSNIKSMSFNLKKISEVKERSIFLKEYFVSLVPIITSLIRDLSVFTRSILKSPDPKINTLSLLFSDKTDLLCLYCLFLLPF